MSRAVLLGRVSRGERQQDPENQLGALRAAAARHGHQVVEEVALKLSGWDDAEAAEVQRRALAPIEEGRADLLMVWAWDRFSRGGIADAFALLARLEEHLGAGFWSMQEPFLSTSTADKKMRELLLALASWNARWESERRSERVKAKKETKVNRAAALGERATWGLGRLASPVEAARARELRAGGMPVRKIGAELGLSKSQVARIVADVKPGGGS